MTASFINRNLLMDRFLQKMETAEPDGLETAAGDWEDRRGLLKSVFDAFHSQQRGGLGDIQRDERCP